MLRIPASLIVAAALAFTVQGQEQPSAGTGNRQSSSTDQSSQSQSQNGTATQQTGEVPTYVVNVVERTAQAVDYRDRGGSTKIAMRGTTVMPNVTGDATVTGHTGRLALNVSLHHLNPAHSFGPQYLTYVLWAITPEGRPSNLGEVIPNGNGDVGLQVTTGFQSFGLIVTAEPYFAVTRPSDFVVAENQIPNDVKGFIRSIDVKYELLRQGEYTTGIDPNQLPATAADFSKVPLELLEARNAVAIAKQDGASQYASDTLDKAEKYLAQAEDYYNRKQGRTPIGTVARAATQTAEDARLLTADKKQQERAAAARQEMENRIQSAQSQAESSAQQAQLAKLQAQQEAEQRAQVEQEREAAQRAQSEAEQARLQAEQQAQQAENARLQAQQQAQQAEQDRQAALQQQQQLQQQADQSRQQAQQAEQARAQLQQQAEQQRTRLLNQLNQVLQTRDTARGLVANMPDVLFAFNKATLRSGAKLRLAKISGILLAYPDLKLEIDGFTDNIGTPQYNQVLSEKRAATVRDFLIEQGVPVNNVMALGKGQSDPIASNRSPQGRQQNRRVELVVSGAAIGQNVGGPATQAGGSEAGSNTSTTPMAAPAGTNSVPKEPASGTTPNTVPQTEAPPNTVQPPPR